MPVKASCSTKTSSSASKSSSGGEGAPFYFSHVAFEGGNKIEILQPVDNPGSDFLVRFLDRNGENPVTWSDRTSLPPMPRTEPAKISRLEHLVVDMARAVEVFTTVLGCVVDASGSPIEAVVSGKCVSRLMTPQWCPMSSLTLMVAMCSRQSTTSDCGFTSRRTPAATTVRR